MRITTRYDEHDFARALMGVLHETGHGLYEAGLPRDWRRQPVGNARGMALHESQSLLMEMQACRSDAFLEFAAPRMRAAFGKDGPAWTADNLHRLYTRVAPGYIRVDADEVTYPLHIMLRYRLERAMLAGDLSARRPARRLERGHARASGHRAAGRRPGLPAGHPLAGWRLGLLPDLYAGGAGRGPALRRRPAGQSRPSSRHRQGRF